MPCEIHKGILISPSSSAPSTRLRRWSLPVRLEERDDGRVAFAFCDGQRRPAVIHRPVDLRAFVQQQQRHVDAARLLLEKGAEVDQAMNDGWTPLRIAKFQGHSAVVALLGEHRK